MDLEKFVLLEDTTDEKEQGPKFLKGKGQCILKTNAGGTLSFIYLIL